MTPEHPRIAALADVLAGQAFEEPAMDPALPRAAVALVLRPGGPDGPELLLIRRAEREGDPWSGHMALPGGREQAEDVTPAATAARETREEVGIDVRAGRLLGPVQPVWPMSSRAPRILVRAFVFWVDAPGEAVPNEEVDEVVWVPVEELRAPGSVTEHLLEIEGHGEMRFPAFGTRGYVIWGLTHRILTTFLELWARTDPAG